MALNPLSTEARAQRNQRSRDALLNTAEQYVTPNPQRQLAANPIGLISSGLQGIASTGRVVENRPIEQRNLDRAQAIRQEAQDYTRGQATLARDDRLAAQALDEAFRQQTFQAGRDDAAALAQYRADTLAEQRANRAATESYRTQQLGQRNVTPVLGANKLPIGSIDKKTGIAYDLQGNQLEGGFGAGTTITDSVTGAQIDPTTGYEAGLSKEQVETARSAASNFDSAQGTLALIDSLGAEDFRAAGGKSTYLPDILTGSAGGKTKFEELSGKGFLENVASFEGKGALSDAEGRAIRAAYNGIFGSEGGLKTGVPEEQVYDAINTIRQNLNIASSRAQWMEENKRQPTIRESRQIAAQTIADNPLTSWEDFQTGAGAGGSSVAQAQEQRLQDANNLRREAGLNVPQQQRQAPQGALDYLRANPNTAAQFQELFGYLPEGF